MHREPLSRQRRALGPVAALVAALLATGLAGPLHAQPEQPQQPAAPASPSAPPFWARPKPAANACPCDAEPAAAAQPADSTGLLTGMLAGAGLVLLGVFGRRLLRKPAPAAAPEPRARAAPPPMPVDPSLPTGFDPRARLVTVKPPAKAAGAATTATQAAPDFAFHDPGSAPIELAQSEPGAESDRAVAFYSEVAYSLMDALHKEPTRQDLRFKLLEIHFARKQVTEFVTLAHEYLARNRGLRDKAWREISSMGIRLAPEHALFGGGPKDAPRPARRMHQMRRFHEREIDQGRIYSAQQALATDFDRVRTDAGFQPELERLLADVVRRPSPLTALPELPHVPDVARIFVKHEDRGRFHDAMAINVLGQMLVAQRLGRKRVVTATRDGHLGHVVASAAARLGLECMVYITERDLNHYYARVLSMRRLGAILRPIPGNPEQEQPDPRRVALEAWLNDSDGTQYVSGLSGGPAPYPDMVRLFLSTLGRETAAQMREAAGALPTAVIASASDGHLGLGLLAGLLEPAAIQLFCVEEKKPAEAAESAPVPAEPVPTPAPRLLLRREHRWLRDTGRVAYADGDEQETLRIIEQFHANGATLPTESARALAEARSLARRLDPTEAVVVLLTNQEGADFRGADNDW